jgi:poly(hydroxyalkanoate) granule-associated protein
MGLLSQAQEEGEKLFETLVDAGKQVERVLPSPADALRDAAAALAEYWKQLQKLVDHQVTAALHHLGVPTKSEVDRLTRRIEQLTASIEALRVRS